MPFYEFIYQTPGAGLVGAAVKLRLLTDHAIGLSEDCQDEAEGEALRDVRRVVERELKAKSASAGETARLRGAGAASGRPATRGATRTLITLRPELNPNSWPLLNRSGPLSVRHGDRNSGARTAVCTCRVCQDTNPDLKGGS